jgi:phthalate 4,5-dioxygenase
MWLAFSSAPRETDRPQLSPVFAMKASDNQRLTQVGPNTPGGMLLRRYWHPVALLDEVDPALSPEWAARPVKPVRLLGEDFVLFADTQGHLGLLQRQCPHRGADLAFGRLETPATSRWGLPADGLRCPFHGWKFGTDGHCIDTPGEPEGSRLCDRVQARSLPLAQAGGVVWAWLGEPAAAPPLPNWHALLAPASHAFAFKGLWHCNWLQAQEVGLDPAHTSFLHAFFEDETDLSASYGRQFRGASAGDADGQKWPMTRIMREFHRPDIRTEASPWGQRITTLRRIHDQLMHVRITHGLFPNGFVIPLSETITITQLHVPIDDTLTWWVSLFTSFADPIDHATMRQQRLRANPAPAYAPLKGAHNQWGYNPVEQQTHTLLGMGQDDINVHDQWACESMGAISDRTQEHLGTTDRAIMAHRRMLLQGMDALQADPAAPLPGLNTGDTSPPETIDGLAPGAEPATWGAWAQAQMLAKRHAAPWLQSVSGVVAHTSTA